MELNESNTNSHNDDLQQRKIMMLEKRVDLLTALITETSIRVDAVVTKLGMTHEDINNFDSDYNGTLERIEELANDLNIALNN